MRGRALLQPSLLASVGGAVPKDGVTRKEEDETNRKMKLWGGGGKQTEGVGLEKDIHCKISAGRSMGKP